MNRKHLSLFGLKFHPFRPEVPLEALLPLPSVEAFCRRIELTVADGGFAMVTGDPGTGKSVALRLLANRLKAHPEFAVGAIDHPQSHVTDFYRELGECFQVSLPIHNRWVGFKGLRARWSEHIENTRTRPILIIDEAQEMNTKVMSELRILASKEFDSQSLLCVVFAGDARLPERFRHADLQPIGSRIRRRLHFDAAERDELLACLDHLLDAAGNPSLMTSELKTTLAEHSAGNYRIMTNLADELLAAAIERNQAQLDEKLYLEVFAPPAPKKAARKK